MKNNLKIYDLPIEPIPERYSMDWQRWFREGFEPYCNQYYSITPLGFKPENIKVGEFLDVYRTFDWKFQQLSYMMRQIQFNHTDHNTWIFMHDGWCPGIGALDYVRQCGEREYKIAMCLHAGTWDENDFISQCDLRPWAQDSEKAWMKIADAIFVATNFHKELILDHTPDIDGHKIYVTGFPLTGVHTAEATRPPIEEEVRIVFPHRLAVEKGPLLWRMMQDKILENQHRKDSYFHGRKVTFVTTKEECQTKEEYYKALASCHFAVSFAAQETWGIAMQEAVLAGCIPIVPNRLAYTELYPVTFRYPYSSKETITNMSVDVPGAINLIEQLDLMLDRYPSNLLTTLQRLQNDILKRGHAAIPNMLTIMEKLSNADSPE